MTAMLYSAESLTAANQLGNALNVAAKNMARERAELDGRTLVTAEDVRESVVAALAFVRVWHRDMAEADT